MALTIVQTSEEAGKGYWDWEIHLEGSDDELDRVKYVEYVLHETFPDPIRKISDRSSGFQLETSGWGTFRVYITIKLRTGSEIEESLNISFDRTREKSVVI